MHVWPQLRPQHVLLKFWSLESTMAHKTDHVGISGQESGPWFHPGTGVGPWQALFLSSSVKYR